MKKNKVNVEVGYTLYVSVLNLLFDCYYYWCSSSSSSSSCCCYCCCYLPQANDDSHWIVGERGFRLFHLSIQ